ncbi:sensor histidine kinase [Microterricola viridarii]|uniref:Histidine kinase-, DNA gyrase B-, and HSP90-like ATPase n=1 Tax=Microterricola viridarii TaxID=412690 RepID=A0A1H1WET7_9MICO|nr:ATP-binding protein [Microterricola viridarii]SDS94669.1 Histidine kinase-, DNA gyrase B-, and HSP90-like ATPase [Microterricola viridarii]
MTPTGPAVPALLRNPLHRGRAERSPLRRSLDRALLTILATGLGFTLLLLALLPLGGPETGALLLFPVNLIVYLCAGLLAWFHRPSNRMGALILLAGGALFLSGAGNTEIPLFILLGTVAASLPLAVFIHLLLAFPSGMLPGRAAKMVVATAYATSILLQLPSYLLLADGAMPGLTIVHEPELAVLGEHMQSAVGGAAFVATAAILLVRLRRATRSERRVLAPLYGYGVFAIVVILFSTRFFGAVLGWDGIAVAVLQLSVLAGVPIAFALAVLRGGVARTGELEELGAWLGAAGDEKPAIAVALARTLGDPSIEVWFWVPGHDAYVDVQGVEVTADVDAGRGLEVVELDGRRIGAISYDNALMVEPELARTAGRVVAIALDRERLTAELRSSRRDLQLSRERLVEVADAERRRIAQDLHDGLQVQLVLLALEAQQLGNGGGASMEERATALRKGIDAAATELRDLVHSVMPAALVQRGLSAAAEDLVDRMPIPTVLELDVADGDCPPVVESIAYFVVAEALANAVKYSQARSITVRLHRQADDLHIEVLDDGIGGARPSAGAGLRGMAERIDVLGGSLAVASEPGRGTRIKVEVPCGS